MEFSPSDSEQDPLLLSNLKAKGGYGTLPFIVGVDTFEKMASIGLMPNMILYLKSEYGLQNARAVNILFLWSSATNFMPIVGAFLCDSFVGRFRMVSYGSITSLLGMILLLLTTIQPRSPCHQVSESCRSPTTFEFLVLYTSFALMSFGSGGVRSSSIALAVDQLSKREKEEGILERFFNWYCLLSAGTTLIAMTFMVYIQDKLGWTVGFGVPVVLMVISVALFFSASPFYIKRKPKTNLFSGYAQVLVASYKNRLLQLPSQVNYELYHNEKEHMTQIPTEKLRFLNKACVIRNPMHDLTPDGRASDPWSLCTVDQVEELKTLIRIIPIWTTGIMLSVNMSQSSFLVLEASSMDRHVTPNFQIPAGSFGSLMMVSLLAWIVLYDRVGIPLASKIMGKPARLGVKQKMGIGLLSSCIAIGSLAVVESFRRAMAIKEGFSDDPQAVVSMSALWLLPRQIFDGLAEASNIIGQSEFYLSELPQSMSSLGAVLFGVGSSAANLISSLILNIMNNVTKRGGEESWLASNINKGHYDYYYWLICGLSFLNFLYYLHVSKAYGPCKGEKKKSLDEGDD